jgi:hypothetical protein
VLSKKKKTYPLQRGDRRDWTQQSETATQRAQRASPGPPPFQVSPLPRGHLVKWLGGTFLFKVKTGRSGSTFGRHSPYADQCAAAVLAEDPLLRDAHTWLTRQSWSLPAVCLSLPLCGLHAFRAHASGRPGFATAHFGWVVPFVLAARLGFGASGAGLVKKKGGAWKSPKCEKLKKRANLHLSFSSSNLCHYEPLFSRH